jgi:hypothetical protein
MRCRGEVWQAPFSECFEEVVAGSLGSLVSQAG